MTRLPGELHVAQGCGFGEMVGGEGEGPEGCGEFVGEFYAEVFIVRVVGGDQVEAAGGCDYSGARMSRERMVMKNTMLKICPAPSIPETMG